VHQGTSSRSFDYALREGRLIRNAASAIARILFESEKLHAEASRSLPALIRSIQGCSAKGLRALPGARAAEMTTTDRDFVSK
jgi:hypothetical protein